MNMESIALYDAKNRLSELCNKVTETGEPCVISRRGKPIVKLVPIDDAEEHGSVWSTVEEAQAKYGTLDADFDLPDRSEAVRPSPLG
ncbi:MAG: prevent-host-death family protein [Candidatus Azotimanducaceae bacterium]|jgi:prevent-host-death family protein